jgi:choline dehydrogenase-like flavoprotein
LGGWTLAEGEDLSAGAAPGLGNVEREFDAIVVGSGPGGASVARELSRQKKRVLILERGGNGPLGESIRAATSVIRTTSVGDRLSTSRAFTTGGTTAVYFAVADQPPLDTFLSLGIDLSAAAEEAKRELPLNELPDSLLGAQALKVRDSALQLGYPWKKNTMLVDLSRCNAGYTYESKWNARSYVEDAVADGATLVNHAKVMKVLVDQDRAVGVEYRVDKGKDEFDVHQAYGSNVVLAAGGPTTPVILRDSGVKNVADRGFYCHPGFGVFGIVPGLKSGENYAASMGAHLDDGIGIGDANFARAIHRMFMLGSRRFVRAFMHSNSIGVGVMVHDTSSGELRDDNRYSKKLNEDDYRRLAKGEEIAREIVRHAGGKFLFKSPLGAGHIGGAIRIGEHVDENLQTELRNLYVCDGSIIPESVRVSPTLTLICLGKYLGRHLAQAH